MTTTHDTDPTVARYLLDLGDQLRRLPRRRRDALRQQILEHIDELTAAASSPAEVRSALDRLGSPRSLVESELDDIGGRRRLLAEKARDWGWRRWAAVAVVLAAVGSVGGYVVDMARQPSLVAGSGVYAWVDPWDRAHERDLSTVAGDEVITPIRPGHRQGFIVPVFNGSSWPQTILGPAPDEIALGRPSPPDIEVGVGPQADRGTYHGLHFQPSATIPPGHIGYIRETWLSQRCRLQIGSTTGDNTVSLQVRVGWFTRNEQVNIDQYFVLQGTAASGCPG